MSTSTNLSARHIAQIAKRLRLLRMERGLTQRGLAEESGISVGLIASIERNWDRDPDSGQALESRSNPSLATMLGLAGALKLGSIEQLIGELPSASLFEKPTEESPPAP